MNPDNEHENRVDFEDLGNRHRAQAEEARLNHARRAERDALFRRFGYDPDVAVEFVLAKALPLPGPVLDIGTGKGRFVVALAPHCTEVTTVDISASEQRFARLTSSARPPSRPGAFSISPTTPAKSSLTVC